VPLGQGVIFIDDWLLKIANK